MSLSPAPALRDLTHCTFPLEPQLGLPWQPWFAHYPSGVPRGLVYPSLRVEQLLLCAASRYPDRRAVWYYHTKWTFRELCERIRQAAGNFARLGIRTGDRVVMALPNCPEFIVAWFALHWLGAEVVPANPLYAANDLVRLVRLTRARAILALDLRIEPVLELTRRQPIPLLIVASLAPHLPISLSWPYRIKAWLNGRIRAAESTRVYGFEALYQTKCAPIAHPVLTDPDRPAVLQPTGGTTGSPKVAILTHRNLVANVAQLHVWSGMAPGGEVVLSVLPFFHVFGATIALLSPLAGGATLLLQARFLPRSVWNVMEREHPTVAPMVPFMFASLNEEMQRRQQNIQGLRMCLSGASAMDPEVRTEFQRRTGAVIFEGYGLSEASPVSHANPPDATARSGSIGLPLPNTIARIVDVETGQNELRPGEIGELIVKGPQVMAGYLDAPEETAHMLRDGWLYTGDLACMGEDGFFALVDRKKDMIKSGGLNIYPSEIEKVLASHPSVRECAVIGVPDKMFGERVVGYVVAANGAHVISEQLKLHCRRELASYKVPRTIEVCDKLPTNFLGKVRRVELRTRAASTRTAADGAKAAIGSVEMQPCPKP